MQGHNHVYERTNPLIYGAGDEQRPLEQAGSGGIARRACEVEPARDGTTYVVVGHRGHAALRLDREHETDRNFDAGKGSGSTVFARRQEAGRARASTSRTSA